ncbi:MAG: CDP-alcohol phosphatidyltransferase family protein [Thermomicrobiales bacterium]
MISELLGPRVRGITLRVGEMLARLGLTPNLLTAIGLILNVIVAIIIATSNLVLGGILLLIAGGFDMLDGAVARASGTVTKFGGFLDSTVDRYSEVVVYGGVLIYVLGGDDFRVGSLLIYAATAGSLLISYARARAEAAGYRASVGLLARPERVLILALGLMFNLLIPALWILAVGTHLTVITRMAHVWRISRAAETRDA